MKRKSIIAILAVALVVAGVAAMTLGSLAADLPFGSLFFQGFGGYTSDEGEILTSDYISSQAVSVTAGETVWFGPCDPVQYFQLVGQDAAGNAVTDKIRGKELTQVADFANGMVIYTYTVPSGVEKLVFSAPASVAPVYIVSKTEVTELKWWAFWDQQETVDPESYVGKNSYYKVEAGDMLYFGAITEADALTTELYDQNAEPIGVIEAADLRLVETFGGDHGIYCYTVPANTAIRYVYVNYDIDRVDYYNCYQFSTGDAVEEEAVVAAIVDGYGVPTPLQSTVEKLEGHTALFLGDSITYGARDRANIYKYHGSWAGRIGYYAGMDVTNNGVSGACITTARQGTSEGHYILNNLLKTKGTTYDYVIMHGMFNDISEDVKIGTMQGKANFDPAKADVTTFAGGLELLFYTAKQQNPDAILGYIVNFHTERTTEEARADKFVAAAIAICEDWGIEYLDLFNRTGFSVEFDDGLHPSSAGYDSMYCIVANWMASLDGTLEASEKTAYQPTYTSDAKIMSYNVFWDVNASANTDYADITDRVSKVMALIGQESPDILLTQEVSPGWMQALKQVSGYSYYGYSEGLVEVGSMGMNSGDEATPILWKTDKYTLVDSGYIHISDGTTESKYDRTPNWVVLQDKTTQALLMVMNYHAVPDKDGYVGDQVRNETAKLVMEEICKVRAEHGDIPVILGGDLNMSQSSTAYFTMVGNGVSDARKIAAVTAEEGSYNAWTRTDVSKYSLGDYIFAGEGVQVDVFDVLCDEDKDEATGKHISDHSPLVVEIRY